MPKPTGLCLTILQTGLNGIWRLLCFYKHSTKFVVAKQKTCPARIHKFSTFFSNNTRDYERNIDRFNLGLAITGKLFIWNQSSNIIYCKWRWCFADNGAYRVLKALWVWKSMVHCNVINWKCHVIVSKKNYFNMWIYCLTCKTIPRLINWWHPGLAVKCLPLHVWPWCMRSRCDTIKDTSKTISLHWKIQADHSNVHILAIRVGVGFTWLTISAQTPKTYRCLISVYCIVPMILTHSAATASPTSTNVAGNGLLCT